MKIPDEILDPGEDTEPSRDEDFGLEPEESEVDRERRETEERYVRRLMSEFSFDKKTTGEILERNGGNYDAASVELGIKRDVEVRLKTLFPGRSIEELKKVYEEMGHSCALVYGKIRRQEEKEKRAEKKERELTDDELIMANKKIIIDELMIKTHCSRRECEEELKKVESAYIFMNITDVSRDIVLCRRSLEEAGFDEVKAAEIMARVVHKEVKFQENLNIDSSELYYNYFETIVIASIFLEEMHKKQLVERERRTGIGGVSPGYGGKYGKDPGLLQSAKKSIKNSHSRYT